MVFRLILSIFVGAVVLHRVSADPESLENCLRRGIATVIALGDPTYEAERWCRNRRLDFKPSPLAIARVSGVPEVQAAIRCARDHMVQACVKAGQHGFDNAAGCTGGVAIDVQDMQNFSVDEDTSIVRFDTGHTLGQLYFKLYKQYGLAVPGGAVSGVGASGLFLGCGRGMLSHLHGLACDSLLGIEYVDATGELLTANATVNADLYWMARGSGGNFPGLVTTFIAQAYKAPVSMFTIDCTLPLGRSKHFLRAWTKHLPEMYKPEHRTFTHATIWGKLDIRFGNSCIDCDGEQLRWFKNTVHDVAQEASAQAFCNNYTHSWLQQVLFESGVYQGMISNHEEALLDRNQGWGAQGPRKAVATGAHMIYDYNMSEELLETVHEWTGGESALHNHPWAWEIMLYPLGGPVIEQIPSDAGPYRSRDAKLVLHYKHAWEPEDFQDQALMLDHHEGMSLAFDEVLPCRGFYNYLDPYKPCARSNDEWLGAFFNDVDRMRHIKQMADPSDLFRSRLWKAHAEPTPLPSEPILP